MIKHNHAQDAIKITDEILSETGPRLTGSESCQKAGDILQSLLEPFCDTSVKEPFKCSRDAFLFFIPFFAVTYFVAFLMLLRGGTWILGANLCIIAGAFVGLFEFVFYKEVLDVFFKKVRCNNIVGTINPKNKIKQTIILSGHYDSPYVFRFLNQHQKLYKIRVIINIGFYIILAGLTVWSGIQFLFYSNIVETHVFVNWFLAIGAISMSQFLFFTSKQVSPGAGDNLIVPGILVKLAELLSQKKMKGDGLETTQLIFLCPDAEESGLRGAREYVKQHHDEFKNTITFNFNMDSIYRLQDIQFLESEINGLVQLDDNIREECQGIAKKLGYQIPSSKIPFGGGATDAAEFAKAEIPSLSIIGLDTEFSGDVPYHTAFDTPDKIEPEAVLACMQIAESYIYKKDTESSP